MHDILAKVVAREAGKLNTLSEQDLALLPESSLEALEILARCAKALKLEDPPKDPVPGDATAEADLRLVDGP